MFPEGGAPVKGELTDPDSLRAALDGVSGLFLLSPVAADELTGTLIALDLAHEAGVRDLVYLSVIYADRYRAPPHFAAKAAAERVIEDLDFAATILRPGFYMQNDAWLKDRILGDGVYDPPVGNNAVLTVDIRDLGEVAAKALIRGQEAAD
ncbi:MAG: SDR family oxidoreductase, partial [Gammaproteobacteria bacterium]